MSKRKLVIKAFLVALLGAFHLSQAPVANAASMGAGCSFCATDCPSMWEWDAICHQICNKQSVGYCPGSVECDTWEVGFICQGNGTF